MEEAEFYQNEQQAMLEATTRQATAAAAGSFVIGGAIPERSPLRGIREQENEDVSEITTYKAIYMTEEKDPFNRMYKYPPSVDSNGTAQDEEEKMQCSVENQPKQQSMANNNHLVFKYNLNVNNESNSLNNPFTLSG